MNHRTESDLAKTSNQTLRLHAVNPEFFSVAEVFDPSSSRTNFQFVLRNARVSDANGTLIVAGEVAVAIYQPRANTVTFLTRLMFSANGVFLMTVDGNYMIGDGTHAAVNAATVLDVSFSP
jgi:hypothetical protein